MAIYHASLLPVSQTNSALMYLMNERRKINPRMIKYVADTLREVVNFEDAPEDSDSVDPSLPKLPATSEETTGLETEDASLPTLEEYLLHLLHIHRGSIALLVMTVVYLNKLRERIPKMSRGLPCTRHRVLLATLIVASKYVNDATPKNAHWAKYNMFELHEINLMERQLLYLLDFDLSFKEADACKAFAPFLLTPAELAIRATATVAKVSLRSPLEEEDAQATRSAALNRVAKATATRTARQPIIDSAERPRPLPALSQQLAQALPVGPSHPSSQPFPVLRNLGRRISSNLFRSASNSSVSSASDSDDYGNSSMSSGDFSTDSERSVVYSSPDTSDMEDVDLNEGVCGYGNKIDSEDDTENEAEDNNHSDMDRAASRRGHRRSRTFTLKPVSISSTTRNDSLDSVGSESNVPLICQPRKVSGASTIANRSPGSSKCTPSPRRFIHAPPMAKPARSVSYTYAPVKQSIGGALPGNNHSHHHGVSAISTGVSTSSTFSSLPRIRESVSAVFSGRVFTSAKHHHSHQQEHQRQRVQVRTNSDDVDLEKGYGYGPIGGSGSLSERMKNLSLASRAGQTEHDGLQEDY